MSEYNEMIKQVNTIGFSDFNKMVQEVYGLPFDTQRGEHAQNSYITVYGVNGECPDEVGYWTGMSVSNYRTNYDNAKYVGLPDDESAIIEHWKNHSKTDASGYSSDRPFDERYLNDKGEYSFWQPPEYWVLNNLFSKGLIPGGDYLIMISW